MKKKVAINGFGRIGRLVYRAFLERSNEFSDRQQREGIEKYLPCLGIR